MISEHDRVILTVDVPEEQLVAGDSGTIVHVYEGRGAFEVEFVAVSRNTCTVLALRNEQIQPDPKDVGKVTFSDREPF